MIALLVAGTFGFVWTAPWKKDVDTLRQDATQQLAAAWGSLGLRADNGTCDTLERPPTTSDRAAFDFVLEQLHKNPGAELSKLVAPSQPTTTVRQFAEGSSSEIGRCFVKLPSHAKGWDGLKERLDAGVAATRAG